MEAADAKQKKLAIELLDLHVYRLADEVSDYVWDIVARWQFFDKKTLGDQWVRSADSIAANIAEGYGRYFFGEYVVFLYYARGSLQETIHWARKAHKRRLITDEEQAWFKSAFDRLPKELNATIRAIKSQQKQWKNKKW
ncbi:four helix bundle protein [Candidatus Uhrbacteria bacterium]|nr:four helix bundle protein [Candidatus Uhrbacteria bacterium]